MFKGTEGDSRALLNLRLAVQLSKSCVFVYEQPVCLKITEYTLRRRSTAASLGKVRIMGMLVNERLKLMLLTIVPNPDEILKQ